MKRLLVLAALLALVGCNPDAGTPSPSFSVQGNYKDENNNTLALFPTNTYLAQPITGFSHWYAVDDSQIHDSGTTGYIVGQNRSNLGQPNELGDMETVFFWSRFDWQVFGGSLYYCHTTDNSPDELSTLTSTSADHTNQAAGCRTGAWNLLTPH